MDKIETAAGGPVLPPQDPPTPPAVKAAAMRRVKLKVGRHTVLLEGLVAAGLGIYLCWQFHWVLGLIASLAGAYEGWTLVNSLPNDTLSEGIWWYNRRPLAPFLLGLATAAGIFMGILSNPWVILGTGMLLGHFVFSRVCEGEELE